jgi:hypothetical protein
MIALVVLSMIAAQAQPGQAVQPPLVRRAAPTARLDIPDELAPAVLPFMGCLMARDGTEVRGGFDPRPRGVGRGADCGPYREQARSRADMILVRIGGRGADERRVYIERTLASIEAFQTSSNARAAAGQDGHAEH